jgi:uncharacterized protein YxeA
MNWSALILVGIVIIVLIALLIWRNIKDEKDFGAQLKNDYHKSKEEEGDIEIDEVMK